jgi:hypothetical protein
MLAVEQGDDDNAISIASRLPFYLLLWRVPADSSRLPSRSYPLPASPNRDGTHLYLSSLPALATLCHSAAISLSGLL